MALKNHGCLVWGGALDIAPADDDIIVVEQPLLLDPTPILLSSILAKKHAIGATHVLFDIPFGPGAKCDRKRADELGNKFLELSRRLGMLARVIKTDGSQPIGNGLGPALEARDVLWILERDKRGPKDLREKSLEIAGILLEMGEVVHKGKGKKFAEAILNSGRALKKMKDIIRSQGGDANIKGDKIQAGQFSEDFKAQKAGVVKGIDNNLIKRLARLLGAPYNKGSGLYLYKHIGDKVKKGEKLFTLYAESGRKLSDGVEFAEENQIYLIK
jgi:AMP phosphorylase